MKGRDKEKEIRQLFNKELPQAPKNPWFTQKVLNRLPPRRNPGAILEKWIFLICFLGAVTGLVLQSVYVMHEPVFYVRDLVMLCLYFLIFLGMALWLIIPLVREN